MSKATPKRARMQLEDLLLRHGAISDAQLEQAREEQRTIGGDLGRHLVDLGFISEDLLLHALAHQLEIPFVDPSTMDLRAELLQAFPLHLCEQFGVIPVEGDAKTRRFRVATSDPGNRHRLVELEQATGCHLEPTAATAATIEAALRRFYYGDAIGRPQAPGPTIDFEAGERALSQAEARGAERSPSAAGTGFKLGQLTTTKRLRGPLPRQPAPDEISELEPLDEAFDEAPAPSQVSFAELQALTQRVERLEAFVTQPQFAAMMARVERLEQIANQLAQAVRVVGGVLIESRLITLEEYRKRSGLK